MAIIDWAIIVSRSEAAGRGATAGDDAGVGPASG
jgi:hypothetical protein